ncbi:SMC-Scp complex subunit ScpB [Priestia sp. SB1]|uniref:SMC-Scp complex subunit ScpB n=1 Tax=Priestia sp. SB1 TaxID=3132359 RepID=UPI0031799573
MDKHAVESLLFVAKEPLSSERISKILNQSDSVISRWISELEKDYEQRGIRIRRVAGGFEMVTSEQYHEVIEPIVPKEYEFLSRPVLETVTIIATFELETSLPVKKAKIGRYRNIKNPDSGIESALSMGLIKETEQGYLTTNEFLKFFGINDLKELEEKLQQNVNLK